MHTTANNNCIHMAMFAVPNNTFGPKHNSNYFYTTPATKRTRFGCPGALSPKDLVELLSFPARLLANHIFMVVWDRSHPEKYWAVCKWALNLF